MIKPETLWNLFKSSKDATWLGEICVALGKRSNEGLKPDQIVVFDMVTRDSEWTDERCMKERARKKEAYERKRRGENGKDGFSDFSAEKTEKTDSPLNQAKPNQAKPNQSNPSQANPSQANPSQANPSQANSFIDKSMNEEEYALARGFSSSSKYFRPPTWEQVLKYINHEDGKLDPGVKINESDARQWFNYRTAAEWFKDNGKPIRVWRTDLMTNARDTAKRRASEASAAAAESGEAESDIDKAVREMNEKRLAKLKGGGE